MRSSRKSTGIPAPIPPTATYHDFAEFRASRLEAKNDKGFTQTPKSFSNR
jgi:hypothetical protein